MWEEERIGLPSDSILSLPPAFSSHSILNSTYAHRSPSMPSIQSQGFASFTVHAAIHQISHAFFDSTTRKQVSMGRDFGWLS